MKITNVLTDTNVGGAGVLVASVAGALSDKFDIEIIIPKGSAIKSRLEESGAKITELPIVGDKSFCASDVSEFYRYFKSHPSDIVHTHASLSARIGATFAGGAFRISTRHCAYDDKGKKKTGFLQRRLYDLCTDITVSTADFATKNLENEGIPRKKIVTIRNGVAPRRITSAEEKRNLKASLGIPANAKILGCCARLEWVKGQDLLLRAMTELLQSHQDLYCLFVGDGRLAADYKRIAAALGVLSRVRFCGYTSDPTPYQNLFFLNVNTSRGTETSCLANSECMSLGIPTVASDFGGNTEMITEEKNGLLFKADDYKALTRAVERVLSDAGLYSKLKAGALDIYQSRFSIDIMKNNYLKLYEECVALKRR